MTDLAALKQANARRWANAKILRPGTFKAVATHLVDPVAKQRYQVVSAQLAKMDLTAPWAFIAVAHERESSQDWTGSLAQGDPWNRVSVHVPAGRGPLRSWEEAAIDALVNCSPHAARNRDWSIGGTLTMLERYNGLGYASRGRPSPYIWSGTNQYVSGKYVRDGVYDPDAVDSQLGCAGLLMTMMALDPTITFAGVTITPPNVLSVPKPAIAPVARSPSQTPQKDRSAHSSPIFSQASFGGNSMITTWDEVKAFFKDSLTIFWARVQWFGGIVSAGLIVAFSGYDFTQLTSMDVKAAFKMLAAVAVAGVLTEIARRRTL